MKYLKWFNSLDRVYQEFINKKSYIDKICKQYNIKNYFIRPDGSVNVDGDVDLNYKNLLEIPLKFNKVTGNFICNGNKLTTLEGGPKEVGGFFKCVDNNLKTLKGSPERVGNDFYCSYNNLTTLEGSPEFVGNWFICHNNRITTIESGPKELEYVYYHITDSFESKIDCRDNPVHKLYKLFKSDYNLLKSSLDFKYLRGTNIVKSRFLLACQEAGITMPEKINGYNYI